MSLVTFNETIFSSKGKQGILPGPDSDGYYTVVLGALNCYNSSGEYYVADKAIDLFRDSSAFQRRVKNGALFSEVGHPRRQIGQSDREFYARMVDILDANICGHISEVSLDLNFGQKNPDLKTPQMIAIMGKVKPAGDQANTLQLSLENRKQNTAFSVRGITDNYERNNRIERVLQTVITFDHVVEPGIKPACKAYVPGLESYSDTRNIEVINPDVLTETIKRNIQSNRYANESTREFYQDLMMSLQRNQKSALKQW